ncbi:hypothetical protein D3Z36_12815 [Lachnospiraceae bacterium]|nr:hypothetical protein [Lachnospiraceae bacterium]
MYCPVCGRKTRLQIRIDTELNNFPVTVRNVKSRGKS